MKMFVVIALAVLGAVLGGVLLIGNPDPAAVTKLAGGGLLSLAAAIVALVAPW